MKNIVESFFIIKICYKLSKYTLKDYIKIAKKI